MNEYRVRSSRGVLSGDNYWDPLLGGEGKGKEAWGQGASLPHRAPLVPPGLVSSAPPGPLSL